MADKKQVVVVSKGPSMMLVLHNGEKTWANKTGKGFYRCTVCKSETHEKASK